MLGAPPTHLHAGATAAAIALWSAAGTLTALAAYALTQARRSPALLCCLIGGGICVLLEPFWDILGGVYFVERGTTHFITVAGRGMPLWVYLAYHVFAGVSAYLFFTVFRARRPVRTVWTCVGAIFALNLLIEVPFTALHLHTYYGHQPLQFWHGGFPLWWPFVNIGGVLSGALLTELAEREGEHATVLALVLVPTCFGAWEIGTGWPAYAAISSNASYAVTYPAALVSMAIAATAITLIARRYDSAASGAPQASTETEGGRTE